MALLVFRMEEAARAHPRDLPWDSDRLQRVKHLLRTSMEVLRPLFPRHSKVKEVRRRLVLAEGRKKLVIPRDRLYW